MALDKNSFIHFRKTTSVEFAQEFKEFSDWLFAKNDDGNFINIQSFDDETKSVVLSPNRQRNFPVFDSVTSDSSLNNTYFLDDIRLIYYRGVPYDSATDYITGAEFVDDDKISVDPERHILLIPNPSRQVQIDDSLLNVAYIHQLDATGQYNPNEKDASITVYVKGGKSGQTFTIKQSMIAGEATDAVDAVSYWGLKNYIDSRLKDVNVEEIIDTEWKHET